jgi:hypothetical protein
VRVDPKHYQVEFENDRVRVLRIKYEPGEKSVMHSHQESIGVFLTDAHAKFTYPDGRTEDIKANAGLAHRRGSSCLSVCWTQMLFDFVSVIYCAFLNEAKTPVRQGTRSAKEFSVYAGRPLVEDKHPSRQMIAYNRSDLVVGPTHDGGYYLVGARVSYPELLSNDGMGTANAFESLLSAAHGLALSVHLTDPFYDIDVASDLGQLTDELQRMPGKAPRTAKCFRVVEGKG